MSLCMSVYKFDSADYADHFLPSETILRNLRYRIYEVQKNEVTTPEKNVRSA